MMPYLLPALLALTSALTSAAGAPPPGGSAATAPPAVEEPAAPEPALHGPAAQEPATQGPATQLAPVPEAPPEAVLPEEWRRWLEEVSVLISQEEREAFLALSKNYQREAFVDHFWRQRDPYPDTGRNELRERWDERVRLVRAAFGSFEDERSKVLLLNGRPQFRRQVVCRAAFWPLDLWFYPNGSDRYRSPFALIFYQRGNTGPYELWHSAYGREELVSFDRSAGCQAKDSEALRAAIRWIDEAGPTGYASILERVRTPPELGGREWVATFSAYSTDLPAGAERFDATLAVDYPGWHQNRTVAQGILSVPLSEVGMADFAGHRSYNFSLTGEVLRDGALFDTFRYKFDIPAASAPAAAGELPLLFQRYLRPGGPYTLVLKLEDLSSGRFFRTERSIEVPRVTANELPPPVDPRLAQVLAEANAAIAAGETSVKVVPPMGDLLAGLVRFDTLVTGSAVTQVAFALDGERILTKRRPPFSVELDLGEFPRTHSLRATAYDPEGRELASDELLLNIAGSRFRARLIEPQRGKRYVASLRARVEVEVPKGDSVERVELYLNDERVATLYQPPYVQPIVLPEGEPLLYVRAVAYRPDGSSAEDAVFVNAPDYAEDIGVQFVELYTSVLDRQGRPVQRLAREDFQVSEDGVEQEILRFEQVRDLPIHAGILLDVSASMEDKLEATRAAALGFFRQAITPKDRVAMITFNDRPYLAVQFTNELATFASGLAGLKAERGTALYDSLIYSLFYFTGIKGQRALVILSDGKDESSRYGFEDALEYARRAGITLYTISLNPDKGDRGARKGLVQLADETGGRSFFLASMEELPAVYATIQEDLRSQYLVAYQSSNVSRDHRFRRVKLDVDERGLEVKTLSGYYP